MFKNTCSLVLVLAAAASAAACAPFKIEPPPGFVEVQTSSWETRMKAQDNVGLRVKRFENVRGGTLGYWAADLVGKLDRRGYQLVNQQAIRSKNGKQGTRFDFKYIDPLKDLPKFYTVALFVTDRYKVTLELAGKAEHAAAHQARVQEVAGELVVRGCKVASKICGGPQPPRLKTESVAELPEPPDEPTTPQPAPQPADAPAPASAPKG